MSHNYDALIAGGGLSGLLAAARLALVKPEGRYLVIEKEPVVGGRLRISQPSKRLFGYGLGGISPRLFDFWAQTLQAYPGGPDLVGLAGHRQVQFGVLTGQKMAEAPIGDLFSALGAKTLGGAAAAKGWDEVDAICRQGAVRVAAGDDSDDDDAEEGGAAKESTQDSRGAAPKSQAFGAQWKSTRKVPAAVVLEHLANVCGVPDVWSASATAVAERATFHASGLYAGPFEEALGALMGAESFARAVTVKTGCRIVDADFADDLWTVRAEGDQYQAKQLVVAQPPWQATAWLPRRLWPSHVLQVASKTKPVSVVVLTEEILIPETSLPDLILVPAEHVQIIRSGPKELAFQATIDYELSLQAPAVGKAVKALKRARKKLLQLHPRLVTEVGHIALQPIAWSQSPAQSDRKWLDRFGKKAPSHHQIFFVGDAYGVSYDGDLNILTSVTHLTETLGS